MRVLFVSQHKYSPRRGIFKERLTYRSIDSECTRVRFMMLPGEMVGAMRHSLYRAPGFGLLLGISRVDGIPWRNFGGRTAALVRSVLRRPDKMVF